MKKILVLLVVCFSTILVGCVNTDLTLDIDKKGNATMSMKLLANDYLMENMEEEDLSEIKEQYEADTIEEISENGQSGYLLTKNLGNVKDGESSENEDILDNEFIDIVEEKGLIFNTYDVTIKIKDAMLGEMTQEDMAMINFIGGSANMNFHVVTPFEFLESNATNVSQEEDGRTNYSWNYSLSTLDNINVKFKAPNIINIMMIGGGLILIVGIGGFIFIRKRKNKEAE